MDAKVIRLQPEAKPVPVCSNCEHVALSQYGCYCTLYHEHVEETVAQRCGDFEEQR